LLSDHAQLLGASLARGRWRLTSRGRAACHTTQAVPVDAAMQQGGRADLNSRTHGGGGLGRSGFDRHHCSRCPGGTSVHVMLIADSSAKVDPQPASREYGCTAARLPIPGSKAPPSGRHGAPERLPALLLISRSHRCQANGPSITTKVSLQLEHGGAPHPTCVQGSRQTFPEQLGRIAEATRSASARRPGSFSVVAVC